MAKSGTIIFELREIRKETAYQALEAAIHKLPKNNKGDKKINYYYKVIDKNENK